MYVFLSGEKIVESAEGDVLFSICSYVAENDEALNLVEGERVYVLGKKGVFKIVCCYSFEIFVVNIGQPSVIQGVP